MSEKNNGTINKGMSNLTKDQKRVKKALRRVSDSYIKKFQDELGDNENIEMKEFLQENVFSAFDDYKASEDKKEKNKIVSSLIEKFQSTLSVKDKGFTESLKDSLFLVFDKLIENLAQPNVTEMNYQVLRVNMIEKLIDSIHSNFIKFDNKDKVNEMVTIMYESLSDIPLAWGKVDMRLLLQSILGIVEYSVKANYYEPDVSMETMSDVFLGTCEKFLTVIPAQLLLYGLESRLKGKELTQEEFDRIVLKLNKDIEKYDNENKN